MHLVNTAEVFEGQWCPERIRTVNRTTPQLLTVGVMADELSVPIHRIVHVLKTREQIRPRARAGRVRLFDRAGLESVRRELIDIAARRRAGTRSSVGGGK